MTGMIKGIQEAGQARAAGLALKGAVGKSMQAIEDFFSRLESYISAQMQRKMVASKQVDTLNADAEKVRQQIDETVLLETKTIFQLYAVMWGKASEAEAVVSGHEDELFTTLGQQVHDYAVSVHEWINEELQSLC